MKKVIIWGTGWTGKKIFHMIKTYWNDMYEVSGFADNNPYIRYQIKSEELVFKDKILDKTIHDIYSIDEVKSLWGQGEIDGVIIGVHENYYQEVESQLNENGIPILDLLNYKDNPNKKLFELDDTNKLLTTVYKENNYKIITGYSDNNICLVFCSSNGIYFPNDVGTFNYNIVENDRYDWENVAKEYLHKVKKIIFIRDVRKNFYVTGINEQYNSVDKVIDFLKRQCEGYRTITVGSSAGGYMAMILGIKLSAYACFSWGGQFDLWRANDVVENYYYLRKFANNRQFNKYYSILNMLYKNPVPIFYFYAGRCQADCEQVKLLSGEESNINTFTIDSESHGVTLTFEGNSKIFTKDIEKIKCLCKRGLCMTKEELSKKIISI